MWYDEGLTFFQPVAVARPENATYREKVGMFSVKHFSENDRFQKNKTLFRKNKTAVSLDMTALQADTFSKMF